MSLAPRPSLLAGREDLLDRLHGLLTEGTQPRTVVLCGLGGVGKTSVVVEYAHRHLTEVGVAWQVASDDPAVLAAELAELTAQLGDREVADLRDPVVSLHAVLAAYPKEWLLVFDDAPDEAAVRRFLPPAGRGRVLITSRSSLWPGRQVLDVPVLDTDVAACFLVNRTADPDEALAGELAIELGKLPLALEQAAAYIQATWAGFAGYLDLFRQRHAVLLDREAPAGHPASVAATIGLALSRLNDAAPAAAGLLRLLACLAAEPVPLGLLLTVEQRRLGLEGGAVDALRPLMTDSVAAADAVAALRRYSLVTPAGGSMILTHRLVQAVTLDQTPDETAMSWRQAAAALVEAAIPDDTSLPGAWQVCSLLLPHVKAVLDDSSPGAGRIATYLGESGSYLAARDMWRKIADAQEEQYGAEHVLTITARQEAAHWTGEAGDPLTARDLLKALLPALHRLAGAEHPATLKARRRLARFTGRAGDPAAARDLLVALLPVQQRVLGPEHPDTLDTRYGLAAWTSDAKDACAARDLFAGLLADYERMLEPEHQDTLTIRYELARWTGEAGDPAAARDQLAALLPVRSRVLGPEDPSTLVTRSQLARWTGEAGDPAAARDQLAALLPVEERVRGPEDPDTLATRNELNRWS